MNKNPPWVEYNHIWKTKASWLSWLRGGIRRALWNKSPCKLEFIKKNRIKIPNPNPKGRVAEVWGAQCALTGKLLPLNLMNVDHKEGNNSLREIEDIQSFVEAIAIVSMDDLQFVSVEAHKIKNHADKMGISFQEALCQKKAIALQKEKKDVDFIKNSGKIPATTQAKRRIQLVEVLMKQEKSK